MPAGRAAARTFAGLQVGGRAGGRREAVRAVPFQHLRGAAGQAQQRRRELHHRGAQRHRLPAPAAPRPGATPRHRDRAGGRGSGRPAARPARACRPERRQRGGLAIGQQQLAVDEAALPAAVGGGKQGLDGGQEVRGRSRSSSTCSVSDPRPACGRHSEDRPAARRSMRRSLHACHPHRPDPRDAAGRRPRQPCVRAAVAAGAAHEPARRQPQRRPRARRPPDAADQPRASRRWPVTPATPAATACCFTCSAFGPAMEAAGRACGLPGAQAQRGDVRASHWVGRARGAGGHIRAVDRADARRVRCDVRRRRPTRRAAADLRRAGCDAGAGRR